MLHLHPDRWIHRYPIYVDASIQWVEVLILFCSPYLSCHIYFLYPIIWSIIVTLRATLILGSPVAVCVLMPVKPLLLHFLRGICKSEAFLSIFIRICRRRHPFNAGIRISLPRSFTPPFGGFSQKLSSFEFTFSHKCVWHDLSCFDTKHITIDCIQTKK